MADKLRAAQRIASVQGKLHRLAQWKLAMIERDEDAVRERRESILRFLDKDETYAGILGNALMNRLRSVSEEQARLAAAKQVQADKTLDELRKTGCMERLVARVADEASQLEERAELRDVLDQISNRANASPR